MGPFPLLRYEALAFPLFYQAYENNEEMKQRARGQASQNPNASAGDKVLPIFRVFDFARTLYFISVLDCDFSW